MKVLLVEDEVAAMRRMHKLLAAVDADIQVVGEAGSVADAVAWFNSNSAPDLAFFDVQLTDGESFQIYEKTEVGCPVIFTTAFDEHALKAFRVNAMDYLLKPVDQEELRSAIARVREFGIVRGTPSKVRQEDVNVLPVKRFLIRYGDHFKVVEHDDIAYLYSQEKNTFLRTTQGRDLPMDESLDRLEKQLDPHTFYRINRQVIIRIQSIKELLAYSRSRVKVIMDPPFGQDAVVSSERSADFKRWLSGG